MKPSREAVTLRVVLEDGDAVVELVSASVAERTETAILDHRMTSGHQRETQTRFWQFNLCFICNGDLPEFSFGRPDD